MQRDGEGVGEGRRENRPCRHGSGARGYCATLRGTPGRGGRASLFRKAADAGGNACFICTGVHACTPRQSGGGRKSWEPVVGEKKNNTETEVEA